MRCFPVFQEYLQKKNKKKKLSTTVLHLHWNYCLITFSNLLLQGIILVPFKTFQHARLLHVQVHSCCGRAILCFFTSHFPLLLHTHLPDPRLLTCPWTDLYQPLPIKKTDLLYARTVLKKQLKSEPLVIWSIHAHNLCWQKVRGQGKQGKEEANVQVSPPVTYTHRSSPRTKAR